MKLVELSASELKPLKLVQIADLSNVVVIAGPNGVGKTRLISGLLQFIQNPRTDGKMHIRIEATCNEERAAWKKPVLDTRDPADAALLKQMLQKNRKRAHFTSSFLNFESNRSIQQIQPYNWDWNYADPFEEDMTWNIGIQNMTHRFQDVTHSIFRKLRSRREAIAIRFDELAKTRAAALKDAALTEEEMGKLKDQPLAIRGEEFPDALAPFKRAFSQLLAPKELIDPKIQNQQLEYRTEGGEILPITSLSSGEREVVNIVFDFLLRDPSDCIVTFDEPELHLHPELSYRLLQTLRTTGTRNQFIFCTHSAEIITASLENTVVFIAPPRDDNFNQALKIRDNDETHEALELLGQSIGIISLGKKLVLIEGGKTSLDKQTYGQILRDRFPRLVLVPSGGAGLLRSFSTLNEKVLRKTIWGVDFFMLCDRDALPLTDPTEIEARGGGRIKLLSRYHLENYFLDELTISKVFEPLTDEGNWLRSPERVGERLREIARGYVSYAAALAASAFFRETIGNIDLMPKACDGKSADELTQLLLGRAQEERGRVASNLDDGKITTLVETRYNEITKSLADGTEAWKALVPAKPILATFCGQTPLKYDGFRTAYINCADTMANNPFSEIIEIFAGFDQFAGG